jgi:hypothetical protein
MIIKALTIENFKGIREPVRVEFKPITLLFGPNSAGKSTIVQALHYAREILEQNNVDADRVNSADDSFDLGGFKNIVHKHDLNLPIRLRFESVFPPFADSSEFLTKEVDNAWIEYEIKWSNFLAAPLVTSTTVGIDGEFLGKIVCAEDGKRVRISEINFSHHLLSQTSIEFEESEKKPISELLFCILGSIKTEFWPLDHRKQHIGIFLDQTSALPSFVNISHDIRSESSIEEMFEPHETTDWDRLTEFFYQYFSYFSYKLKHVITDFRYIGPIRKTPPRVYSPVRTEDESRWSSGLAAWDLMYFSSPIFIDNINKWLAGEKRLNTGYRVNLKRYKELDIDGPTYRAIVTATVLDDNDFMAGELYRLPEMRRLSLIDEERGIEVQPYDIGIGISQVLPVVVAALDKKSNFVIIEQPELHIHPGLQVCIGDLFISQVQNGQKVFLIETHSEHLLLRLLRRIRETNDGELPPEVDPLTPEQVSVNYIEQTGEGVCARQLHISHDGDSLGEWPKGFFEERAKELL